MLDHDMIGAIYEAAALPERWSAVLENLARKIGARGGTIGRHGLGDSQFIYSDSLAGLIDRYIAGGWHLRNDRITPIWTKFHSGFLTDVDLHTSEERSSLPCYAEFFTPEKADLGAATLIQGASDDGLVLTIEMFEDEEALARGVRTLDGMRPHLARAVMLSAQFQMQRVRAAVEAIEQAGAAAAMLGLRGQTIAANGQFAETFGGLMFDGRDRLRCTHPRSDESLAAGLDDMIRAGRGASIAVRDKDGAGVGALHLLPLRGDARDVFAGASGLAILSKPTNRSLPNADLIQALFDLTPTEARVARAIGEGRSIETISRQMGKSVETVRSHLKRVYSKTATGRQNELSILLTGFSKAIV